MTIARKFLTTTAILLLVLFVGAPGYSQEPEAADNVAEAGADAEPAAVAPVDDAGDAGAEPVEEMVDVAADTPEMTEEESTWAASCEIGFNLAEGNASNRSLNSGCGGEETFDNLKLSVDGGANWGVSRYGGRGAYPDGTPVTRSTFIKTQLDWAAGAREDYFLTEDDRTYLYAAQRFDGNKFAGYNWQMLLDLGVGYVYYTDEIQKHQIEGGFQYGYIDNIIGGGDNRYNLVISALGEVQINEVSMLDYITTYSAELTNLPDDYRIDSALNLSFTLTDRLAFKTGLTVAYKSEPSLVVPKDANGAEIAGATPIQARNTDTTWNNLLVLTLN